MNSKYLIALSLMAGSGITLPASATDQPAAKQSGTEIVIAAPPKGKGQVVFFRKGGFVGAGVGCSLHENGVKLSTLGAGKYFVLIEDPGKHAFMTHSEAKDVLSLEVEPDETQYVTCSIKMGMMVGRPDIRPATAEEFRAMKALKLVDSTKLGDPSVNAATANPTQAASTK
jgi:hypothetical protein